MKTFRRMITERKKFTYKDQFCIQTVYLSMTTKTKGSMAASKPKNMCVCHNLSTCLTKLSNHSM